MLVVVVCHMRRVIAVPHDAVKPKDATQLLQLIGAQLDLHRRCVLLEVLHPPGACADMRGCKDDVTNAVTRACPAGYSVHGRSKSCLQMPAAIAYALSKCACEVTATSLATCNAVKCTAKHDLEGPMAARSRLV